MALTDKQKSWITKHFKNTKNDIILEKLKISHSALHRFAKENGLTKTKQFQKSCQLNATKFAREANKKNNWPPKGYVIPKSEENRFKAGVTNQMRLGAKKNKERIEKSAASRRKTVAAEKRRVLFGLEQKTKLKVIRAPHNKIAYRNYLRRRGYVVDRAGVEIYYTEHTSRSEKVEKTAFEKYRFKIIYS